MYMFSAPIFLPYGWWQDSIASFLSTCITTERKGKPCGISNLVKPVKPAPNIKHRHYLKHLLLNLRELWGGEVSACRENKPIFAPTSASRPARLKCAWVGAGMFTCQQIKQLSFPPWLYQLHRTCRQLIKPIFPGHSPFARVKFRSR